MTSSKLLPGLALSALLLASPALAETGPARLVADLNPESGILNDRSAQGFARIGDRSVFLRQDDEYLLALWVTDGTAQGTEKIGVIYPSGYVGLLGSTGSVAFYYVSSGEHPEYTLTVWRTDGTTAGTFPLTQPLSIAAFETPYPTASIQGGMLFFFACAAELGCELWTSDGSVAGTLPVGETLPGPESADLLQLAATGDHAFLIATLPGEPASLWVADGRARTLRHVRTVPEASSLAAANGLAFFIAQDDRGGGLEVWASDGSVQGTRPVTSFAPRDPFQEASLTLLDGRAWFRADDGAHGFELWSAGAKPASVRRVTNTPGGRYAVEDFAKAGDRIVYVSRQLKTGLLALWTSRGDSRSSARLTGCPGGCPAVVGPLTPLDSGRVVFYGRDGNRGGIWVTDGTAAGTRLLRRTVGWSLSQAVPLGGLALIQIMEEYDTGELWVTDGTAAGTHLAARGGPYWSHYSGWSGRLQAGLAGGQALFMGTADALAEEELLWSSDGTPAGSGPLLGSRIALGTDNALPVPFRDGMLLLGSFPEGEETSGEQIRFLQSTGITTLYSRQGEYSYLSPPVVLGDIAVFSSSEDQTLWRTDGTPEGTGVLFQAAPDWHLAEMVRFGDEVALWFWYRRHPYSNDISSELWLTDGTPEGTRKQLALPDRVTLYDISAVAGRLWFFSSVERGTELLLQPWVSDATPAGTYPLTGRLGDTSDRSFFEAGGRVWFLFGEPGAPEEIWRSDGTPAGTGPAVTSASGAVWPEWLTASQDLLYFLVERRPWVSDGTDSGTVLLADVEVEHEEAPFVEFAGRIWFAAKDRHLGTELWSTDGTPEGTSRLLDIAPGLLGSHPRHLTVWDGRLWFAAQDGLHGMELWVSDGTAEGTRMVQDINPGPSWSVPEEMVPTEGGLFFLAHDGRHGREFWVVP